MSLSIRALLNFLAIVLGVILLVACARQSSSEDASTAFPPTATPRLEPTATPNMMPRTIVDALRNQHPDIAAYCDMVGRVVESPNARWNARTEDAKQEVWILECLVDREIVEATGKKMITEGAYYSLFDSTTGDLQLDDVLAQSLFGAGQYTASQLIDLKLELSGRASETPGNPSPSATTFPGKKEDSNGGSQFEEYAVEVRTRTDNCPTPSIAVSVLDENGNPESGVKLWLYDQWGNEETVDTSFSNDNHGESFFTLNSEPNVYYLQIIDTQGTIIVTPVEILHGNETSAEGMCHTVVWTRNK